MKHIASAEGGRKIAEDRVQMRAFITAVWNIFSTTTMGLGKYLIKTIT